ncbi:hypothetical protein BOX15_Mlig002832g3 [Macrostomum lignano]|uniref:NIF3-like protein 1 n=1 Tax=Macrostomum lignano TaxID=282301 RepID=A0A267GZ77_9PLAT|nr:hypothetical protein BOX15_Mlig002832g3 [Macrostomum lignano]
MNLADAVAQLEEFCPSRLAEDWDNAGLLIEPREFALGKKLVSSVVLTNDLTSRVYEEARSLQADLIVAYHPPLFRPLRRALASSPDWPQRLLAAAFADGVAVYSPHTAWDARPDGLNDWLLAGPFGRWLETNKSAPVTPCKDTPGAGAGRWAPISNPMSIEEAVESVKKHLGLANLQVVRPLSSGQQHQLIRGVAVCAGSGASLLRNIGDKCDLLLTGEMSHHELLWHADQGRSVIVTGHSNCERPYLPVAAAALAKRMPSLVFHVSKTDKDPLEFA